MGVFLLFPPTSDTVLSNLLLEGYWDIEPLYKVLLILH